MKYLKPYEVKEVLVTQAINKTMKNIIEILNIELIQNMPITLRLWALATFLIVFTSYVVVILILNEYKPLKSISISYYELNLHDRWLFQLWIWFISFFIVITGNSFFWLISGLLLTIGVACFPTIERENDGKKVHYIYHVTGAILSICTAFINIAVNTDYDKIIYTFISISILSILIDRKHSIFLIEIAAFLAISFSLFLQLCKLS